MKNFWKKLPKPFFVLAPMADVTDVAFREFIARTGKPDVLYTEFVSCRGLRSDAGRKALLKTLYYAEKQRPIVAQVFGSDPEDFLWCAKFIRKLGFDGIDVNMGCPVKKMVGQGAGASLILDPPKARAIIRAMKKGAGDMPVSVKTRIGYNDIDTEHWIGEILKEKPSALIAHLRTRKEMSKVPAHWEEMKKIVKMAHNAGVVVVGNGDVKSREEGEKLSKETGCDGIMIGRGVFGNPFVFRETCNVKRVTRNDGKNAFLNSSMPHATRHKLHATGDSSTLHVTRYKLRALLGLVTLFYEIWGERGNFDLLKKHFSAYVRGFNGAKELRMKLMETKNCEEALDLLVRNVQ